MTMRPLPPFKARPVSQKQIARTRIPALATDTLVEDLPTQVKATRRSVRASMQLMPLQPKVLRTH
jgi:hypothetical protein